MSAVEITTATTIEGQPLQAQPKLVETEHAMTKASEITELPGWGNWAEGGEPPSSHFGGCVYMCLCRGCEPQ